jgi:uroporphyrinogen-III decarboxylase
MDLTATRQFNLDLFGGPFPGHGVRVNAPGPADRTVLTHGSVEARARMGQAMFEWERACAEAIGDDRVPMAHIWTGTDVFAAAFGSPVHRPADEMPFALPAVFNAEQADRLGEPSLEDGPLGELFALGDRLMELCGDGVTLRIADIQSPFDIAALIWEKESFFRALVEQPEAAHRLLAKVTATLGRFIAAFVARYRNPCLVHYPELWLPPAWGVCLSEDDIGSISPRHFRSFCLPYLRRLAGEFGGISMHSCANGQHQWPDFLGLAGLRYLNLFHPPTSLEKAIATFSGRAVLAPSVQPTPDGPFCGHATYTGFVEECLALARPDTRFFFIASAPDVAEARALAREIKGLCGR